MATDPLDLKMDLPFRHRTLDVNSETHKNILNKLDVPSEIRYFTSIKVNERWLSSLKEPSNPQNMSH